MKLLVVLSYCPFPPRVGGAVVAYNNILELAKRHTLHLLCRAEPRDRVIDGKFFEKVEFVSPKHSSLFVHVLRSVFFTGLGIPYIVTGFKLPVMQKRVREWDEREKYDAILLYGVESIQYCPPTSYQKVIVNIEDAQSIKLRRLLALPVNSLWEKMRLFGHAVVMAHYEKKMLPKMGAVTLLSKADVADMQAQGGYGNLGFVPYGVERRPSGDIQGYERRADGMLVFSGNMFHGPNIDGALHFLSHVFPLVLRDCPEVVLWIVGADPDARIRSAAARYGASVVITGRVKDMSEFLKKAKVSVCPVRLKIGVQTKILEALSWGTPVVTTSAGNSGIGGLSGRELWVEDDPLLFAGRVVDLLRGKNWGPLSGAGRKLVRDRFSWENSALELEQQIMRIRKV